MLSDLDPTRLELALLSRMAGWETATASRYLLWWRLMAVVASIAATPLLGFRRTNESLGIGKPHPRSKLHDAFSCTDHCFDHLLADKGCCSLFRLGNTVGLQAKKRVLVVCASNTNHPNPNAGKGKAENSSSNVADGPPLLTILAGVLVFLIVCWVISSIVLWLVSLIVNVPPS
ncbi:hypothetical protein J5N97_016512 [Dioscorea zingiberensis]|uniref:Uncharacterized protein n=1 Tax=Dioscorea zingiberensis TaxID=325984 RepID=A0A9D5CLA0_9LILI|nr:hypothetical protein J5N97_016512 [Dioscorea zingiberensis]